MIVDLFGDAADDAADPSRALAMALALAAAADRFVTVRGEACERAARRLSSAIDDALAARAQLLEAIDLAALTARLVAKRRDAL